MQARAIATTFRRVRIAVGCWFDSSARARCTEEADDRIDWLRVIPFIGLHIACLGVFRVGVSATALWPAGAARQGFRWWEVDLTFYLLRVLAACGLVWDLKPLPVLSRITRDDQPGIATSADVRA